MRIVYEYLRDRKEGKGSDNPQIFVTLFRITKWDTNKSLSTGPASFRLIKIYPIRRGKILCEKKSFKRFRATA